MAADPGKSVPNKNLPKSISRSNMQRSESLKKKLQRSLLQYRKPGFPHTLGSMTKYNIRIPDITNKAKDFQGLVEKLLIDTIMLQDLEELHLINFCRTFQKLYPLKTAGDGNCLLHAVSMAIWGIHDKAMLLRRLLYISLVEDEVTKNFYSRWERERKRIDNDLLEELQLSSGQWRREWDSVVKTAEDLKRPPSSAAAELPFESLEEIHIFVLANVIQRPIIVISDSIVRGLRGSILGPNNFAGIYIPLLWKPEKCCKTPVVLGYHMGHFTPLVNMVSDVDSAGNRRTLNGEYAVPLVNCNMEPLHIHFISRKEEETACEILQTYLKVAEINWTTPGGIHLLLSARLEHTKISPEYDLMTDYIESLEKQFHNRNLPEDKKHPLPEGQSKYENKNTIEPVSVTQIEPEHDHKHQVIHKPVATRTSGIISEQSRQHHKGKDSARLGYKVKYSDYNIQTTRATLCVNPGCEYFGSIEYGGFCYQCFIDSTRTQQTRMENLPMELSMMDQRCANGACSNMASRRTFPYCHEHNVNNTERQQEEGRLIYIPSMANSMCASEGCRNVASTRTFPYCHEHKDLRMGAFSTVPSREPVLHNEMDQQVNRYSSATMYLCTHDGCTNAASRNTFPFCHEHIGQHEAVTNHAPPLYVEAPPFYTQVMGRQSTHQTPEYEPSITKFKCAHPGCVNVASLHTFPYCHEHHTPSMPPQTTTEHTIGDSYARYEYNPPRPTPQHAQLTEPASRVGSSRKCPAPGCKLFGPPAYNYYCSQHSAMNESASSSAAMSIVCLLPNCGNQANSKYLGLCSTCFVMKEFQELAPPGSIEKSGSIELEVAEPPNEVQPMSNASPGHTPTMGSPEEPLLTSTATPEQGFELCEHHSPVRCIAPECINLGSAGLKGLCEECYKFLKQKSKTPASSVYDDCSIVRILPCVNEGCNMSARADSKFFCTQCCQHRKLSGVQCHSHKTHGSSGFTPAPSSVTSEDFPRQVMPCCNHKNGSPVLHATCSSNSPGNCTAQRCMVHGTGPYKNRKAIWNKGSDPSTGEKSEAFMALERLENNVRVSRRKCKNQKCKNFGNSSNSGYCNDCRARIL